MRIDLTNQVALVTGGAQGIGRAIVEELAANGARVAILDINEKAASALADELRGQGIDCFSIAADVGRADSVRLAIEAVLKRFAGIDILVNNAGVNTTADRQPIHKYSDEEWSRILRIDLDGVFNVSKAVIPHLIARGGGRFVNIASVMGLVPARLQSAYVAAKAAVVNLTRSMALELAPHKILVNGIAPGSILTEATRRFIYAADGAYSERMQSLLSHIPLGRPGTPEEIAHAVLFLVAPESSYVTGSILTVDGGWTAGYSRDW